ncbi:MAG TPA: thermonuclease family protein [Micropepsaceae bacterium]|nr:thermonuclease family protein [Micropepsaceae bacterium]
MGILRVTGSIDLGTFWPAGDSDADTTKILVNVEAGGFAFQATPKDPFVQTHAFDGAKVKGNGASPVLNTKGQVTIRLQGIDAPELHYYPATLTGKGVTDAQRAAYKAIYKEYRQYIGETATVALGTKMKALGNSPIACTAETQVNVPDDVFDTYGRFIGDIYVQHGSKRININNWLLQEGWAFPAFYNSMTADEIKEKIAVAKAGRKLKTRLWKYFSKKLEPFDPTLQYRKKGAAPNAAADKGPVIFPKLFRRQTTWWARNKTGVVKGDFSAYLSGTATASDRFLFTKDFLADPVSARQNGWTAILSGQAITANPEDLVFVEDTSKLFGPDGKPVTSW